MSQRMHAWNLCMYVSMRVYMHGCVRCGVACICIAAACTFCTQKKHIFLKWLIGACLFSQPSLYWSLWCSLCLVAVLFEKWNDMDMYIHTYVYVCIHIWHTYVYVYIHICAYTYIYTYMYLYIYVYTIRVYRLCMYVYMYIHIYMYLSIGLCMYLYMYIHIYMYLYIYIYTYTIRVYRFLRAHAVNWLRGACLAARRHAGWLAGNPYAASLWIRCRGLLLFVTDVCFVTDICMVWLRLVGSSEL